MITGVGDGNIRQMLKVPPTTNMQTNVDPIYKNMGNIDNTETEEHHEQENELHYHYIQPKEADETNQYIQPEEEGETIHHNIHTRQT